MERLNLLPSHTEVKNIQKLEDGIRWLSEAKEKYNIPIITEIMEESTFH